MPSYYFLRSEYYVYQKLLLSERQLLFKYRLADEFAVFPLPLSSYVSEITSALFI